MLAWFVMIPAIVVFGGDTVLFPSDISVAELYSAGGASAVWSKKAVQMFEIEIEHMSGKEVQEK